MHIEPLRKASAPATPVFDLYVRSVPRPTKVSFDWLLDVAASCPDLPARERAALAIRAAQILAPRRISEQDTLFDALMAETVVVELDLYVRPEVDPHVVQLLTENFCIRVKRRFRPAAAIPLVVIIGVTDIIGSVVLLDSALDAGKEQIEVVDQTAEERPLSAPITGVRIRIVDNEGSPVIPG